MRYKSFTETQAYHALQSAFAQMQTTHLTQLFHADTDRFNRYKTVWGPLLYDPSKTHINDAVLQAMDALATEMQLSQCFADMCAGVPINETENRAVLHTALRKRADAEVLVQGKNVIPDIQDVLNKMRVFSDAVISGERRGFSGKAFTDVVNIGIGGSDLGPVMVCEALKHEQVLNLNIHFVSNVDGAHLAETIKRLHPETTLFLIASKTFTTQETMANAHSARNWVMQHYGNADAVAAHFVAISTAEKEVSAFGIGLDQMFEFWDWVGGRYSLWSAIGLSICLAIGYAKFEQLLAGASFADEQTATCAFSENIPMQMAMIGLWYMHFFQYPTYAVIPYDQYLHRFTAYLQQADMESNGKSVDRNGKPVAYATGPIIWGEPGTNGQHAFFQLMHQGTHIIPADFIVAAQPAHTLPEHHAMLLSNCFAQSEAFMTGKSAEQVRAELAARGMTADEIARHTPFRVFAGNRPSSTLVMDRLTPFTLGMLIAIYEHKIFFQGLLWNIYSFDQWGVELGKKLASAILPEITDTQKPLHHDSSTNGLIQHIRNLNSKFKSW